MAMSLGDASDVQNLLAWLTGEHNNDPDYNGDGARVAAARLADRSRKVLAAGMDGDRVTDRWPVPGLPRGCRAPAEGWVSS